MIFFLDSKLFPKILIYIIRYYSARTFDRRYEDGVIFIKDRSFLFSLVVPVEWQLSLVHWQLITIDRSRSMLRNIVLSSSSLKCGLLDFFFVASIVRTILPKSATSISELRQLTFSVKRNRATVGPR